MEEENDPPPSPPLKGVVIITLPPPDDPSQGKTITAFTLPVHHPQIGIPTHQQNTSSLRPPSHASSRLVPSRSLSSSFKKAIVGFAAASTALVFLWACVSSEAPFEFLRTSQEEPEKNRSREAGSILFPLYPKYTDGGQSNQRRLRRQAGIKLGGVSGAPQEQNRSLLRDAKRRKVVDSASVVNSSSTALFPVRGNVFPDGLYYTVIHVGNPLRRFFLDVDTGSDLTWIQCDAPCTSCAEGPNPLYKPTKGKIVPSRDSYCLEVQNDQNNLHCESCQQCDYEIEYADHSSSMGVLARDELPLKMVNEEIEKPSFVFGCAYDQQGQLSASPAKTDGILGLSGSRVGLPSQLANQDIITNVVGHCISHRANDGGYMFLGDEFVPRWGMTWVPMFSSPIKFYQANVQKISYGNKQLGPIGSGSDVGRVVFDTGSSYSYFTNEAYGSLVTSLQESLYGVEQDDSDVTLPICWRTQLPIRSINEVKQFFKPVTIHFANRWLFMSRSLLIPPEGYLTISKKGNACLGILNGTEVHDGTTNILGDITLRGLLVVYDNVQQKIGWVQSDCSKPQKKSEFPFFF